MIDLVDLNKAHKIAARVVAEFGDIYLPVFERLHNDYKLQKQVSLYRSHESNTLINWRKLIRELNIKLIADLVLQTIS